MAMWLLLIVAVLALVAWICARRFEAGIEADLAELKAAPPAGSQRGELPLLLAAYLARTGLAEGAGLRWFQIRQQGQMRLAEGKDWQSFEAVQVYSTAEPSFVWKASFKLFQVVDGLVDGAGRLEARLLGVLSVAHARGAQTTQAQLMRYLAEIVWVPRAIAANRAIAWSQIDDVQVRGVLVADGIRAELRFLFDEAGDIVRVEGERARMVGEQAVLTPWVGLYSRYATVGGVRIPTRAEVRWELETGSFTYWRGSVTQLEFR